MKTLQEQYNLIKEGKGHKGVFMKEAKRLFPNVVPNSATFDQILFLHLINSSMKKQKQLNLRLLKK